MTTVVFSHGKESGPWGSKIRGLAEVAKQYGYAVDSIDYQDLANPEQRVQRLQSVLAKLDGDYVLVGSSMGGYVSLVAAAYTKPLGVFLMAPALLMDGYQEHEYRYNGPVSIVHGWQDDIVPVEHSIQVAQCNRYNCLLIDDGHRLSNSQALLEECFVRFLSGPCRSAAQ